MSFSSKKTSLLILGLTSLTCSRLLFTFFNDPEGPNLLIVVVLAAILYLLSLSTYLFGTRAAGLKKLFLAVLVQVVLVVGLYFVLH